MPVTVSIDLPAFPQLPTITATFVPQVLNPDDSDDILYATEEQVYEFVAMEYGKSRRGEPLRFTWDVTKHLLAKPAPFWAGLKDDREESDNLLWDVTDAPGWARNYAGTHQYVVRVREALEAFCWSVLRKTPGEVTEADLAVLRATYELPDAPQL
jgi:hypothetical protein